MSSFLDGLLEWTDNLPDWEDLFDRIPLHSIVDILLVITPLLVLVYFIVKIKSERKKQSNQQLIPAQATIAAEEPTNAEARFNAIREENQAQLRQRTQAAEQDPSLSVPKRLGTKKAKNLDAKENLKRYREWQLSQEQEQQNRRELLNEAKEKYDREREKQRRTEEAKQQAIHREQEKRKKEARDQFEKQEAAKPHVTEMVDEVLGYVQTRVVVDLDVMATDLGLRKQELHDYVHQQIDQQAWLGVFNDQGKLIYLHADRVAHLRSILETDGVVSPKDAIAIFMGIKEVPPRP